MIRRLTLALASTALIVAPVAAQKTAPTLKTSAPPLATALGEPVAKTWATWWEQFRRALGKLTEPLVGDSEEPELGVDLTKVPAKIASNFPTAPLIADWRAAGPVPSAAPDTVGAFRFICKPSHVLRDDPIVFPGQPGKSHLHQFFGNTKANAYSTYASLRTTGESTCVNKLNRSAYWIPAMLDGKGNVVQFDFASIYYKRAPLGSPACTTSGIACVDLPRGLRMVFGYDMVTGKQPTGAPYFDCQGPGARPGHYRTLTEVAPNCPTGAQLGMLINTPSCWDGVHLDSKNHRDHLGYMSYINGVPKCDASHPYIIPVFTMGVWYEADDSLDRSGKWVDGVTKTWSLSSDDMTGMGMGRVEPGTTIHADWFGAWDDDIMERWTRNCINGLLSCNSGSLGDGYALAHEGKPFDWKTVPRLLPIPTA